MFKKLLVVMMAFMMVFSMMPLAAFAEGQTHTVTFKYVDEEGVLGDEQPYFFIEVKDGQSLDEAMEEQNHYLEDFAMLGYNNDWIKGTESEVDGKTKVTFREGPGVSLNYSAPINEDEVYYLFLDRIGGENPLQMDISIDCDEGIEITGDNGVVRVMNNIAQAISNARNDWESFENYTPASDDFIFEARYADRLNGELKVRKGMDGENISSLDFILTLTAEGENQSPVMEDINTIYGDVCFSIEVPEYEGVFYVYSEYETEDGIQSIESEGPRAEDGKAYLTIWEKLGTYEFGFREGDFDDEEGDSSIPENVIELECIIINEYGEQEWVPILIELEENNTKTYEEVLLNAVKQLKHYPGLKVVEWTFSDYTVNELQQTAEGGMWFNGIAYYDKYLVHAEVSYYNDNYETVVETKPILVKPNTSFEKIYGELDDIVKGIDSNIKPTGWDHEYALSEKLDYDTYWNEMIHMGRFTASKYATYDKYMINLSYSYLDDNGKTHTVLKEDLFVKGGKTLQEVCDELLNKELGTNATYTWALNPAGLFDMRSDEIGLGLSKADAAVVYDDKTPAFTDVYGLIDTVNGYEALDIYDEVFYVDMEALQEVPDYDEEIGISEDISVKLSSQVRNKYGKAPKNMRLESIDTIFTGFDQFEGYGVGIETSLYLMYDKAVFFLDWYDDEGEKSEQYVVELGEKFILPQKGNFVQFWDIGGPTYGGNYQLSGTEISVRGPYMGATSKYRLGVNGLMEVPAGFGSLDEVKAALHKEAEKANKFDKNKTHYAYYDLKLKNAYTDELIGYDSFPTEGVTFFLECPSGVEPKVENFIVTHLITSEGHEKYGETETLDILEVFKGDDGKYYLKIKATSFSPIAIAYEVDIINDNISGSEAGTTAPNTGDSNNMLLWSIIAVAAIAGVTVVLKKYKEK